MAPQTDHLPRVFQQALQAAAARLLELARPGFVVLSGPWAEGRTDEASQMDVFIVAETDRPSQVAASFLKPIRAALGSRRGALVVATPDQWEPLQDVHGWVIHEAAHCGVWLYEAA